MNCLLDYVVVDFIRGRAHIRVHSQDEFIALMNHVCSNTDDNVIIEQARDIISESGRYGYPTNICFTKKGWLTFGKLDKGYLFSEISTQKFYAIRIPDTMKGESA